jgi:hypothetical protein
MKKSNLKKLVKEVVNKLSEDFGNQLTNSAGFPVKTTRDPLNDPLIKEYGDIKTREEAMNRVDIDRAVALLYKWTDNGLLEFKEFNDLLSILVARTIKLHR